MIQWLCLSFGPQGCQTYTKAFAFFFSHAFSALLVYKGLNCCESVYSPSTTEASVSGAYIVAGIWVTDLCVTVHFYLKIHLVESVSDWLLRLNVFEANHTLHYDGRGCFWKEPSGCWDGSVVCIFWGDEGGGNLTNVSVSARPTADIISTVEFNHSGELLATGDKGGRVVIFQQETEVKDQAV